MLGIGLVCTLAYAERAAAQPSSPGRLSYFAEVATRVAAASEALSGSCRGDELAGEVSAGLRRGSVRVAVFHTLTVHLGERCHPYYPDPVERDGMVVYEYAPRSQIAGEGLYSSLGLRLSAAGPLSGRVEIEGYAGPEWIPERRAVAAVAGAGLSLPFRGGSRIGIGGDVRLLRVPFRTRTEAFRGGLRVSETVREERRWRAQPGVRLRLLLPPPERTAPREGGSGGRGWFLGVASRYGPGNLFGDCDAARHLSGQISVGRRLRSVSVSAFYGRTTRVGALCGGAGPVDPENGTRAQRTLDRQGREDASMGIRAAVERPIVLDASARVHGGVEWIPAGSVVGPLGGVSLGIPLSDRLLLWVGTEARVLRVPYRTVLLEFRDGDVVSESEVDTPVWEGAGALRIGFEVSP